MRAVIQRVTWASVSIQGKMTTSVGKGILVFLGIEEADTYEDIDWLTGKIARLRIFPDDRQIMNLSLQETGGEALVVSQFTLHASTRKGNRPSYIKAARPEKAIPLYKYFIESLDIQLSGKVRSGAFGAMMEVSLLNNGPVTILIDTKNRE